MTEPANRQVQVVADLHLHVDGQPIHVSGDGHDITISGADVSGLARHIGTAAAALGGGLTAHRRTISRLANAANRADIRVTLVGRTGPVVAIGRDVDVRVMGLLAGSPHVRVQPGREAVAALVALLRH